MPSIVIIQKTGRRKIISKKIVPISELSGLSSIVNCSPPTDEPRAGHFTRNQFVELAEKIEREHNHGMLSGEAEAAYPRMGFHDHPITYTYVGRGRW